jgi:hypothetical protein
MVGKKLSLFETPGAFSYGALEKALGAVFGAEGVTLHTKFRARIKHLQRLGLPGLKSGKGARVEYSVEQASQWLLALLLSEAGIEPVDSIKLIHGYWAKFLPWFKRAQDLKKIHTDAGSHVFLTVRPHLMGEPEIGFSYRRHLRHDEDADKGIYVRSLTDALNVFHDNLHWD